jgi:hypothetical protein
VNSTKSPFYQVRQKSLYGEKLPNATVATKVKSFDDSADGVSAVNSDLSVITLNPAVRHADPPEEMSATQSDLFVRVC